MRTLFTLTLLTAAALVAPAQDVPDAQAVVRKAITAHGGAAALKAMNTSSSAGKGTMTVNGTELTVAVDVLFAGPDKLRLTLKTEVVGQKLDLVQIVNGDKFAQTTNGKAGPIGEAEKSELKQSLALQDLTTLVPLLTEKYTLKALPAEKFGTTEASVVLATPAAKDAGRPVTLYFDAKTGYLVRYSREALAPGEKGGKKVREDTRLGDFQKFDGAMVATTATVTQDGKPFMSLTMTTIKALPAIDAKEFAVAP